jgi:hypothetical protein
VGKPAPGQMRLFGTLRRTSAMHFCPFACALPEWRSRQTLCDTFQSSPTPAGMAELADAADSKSADRKVVGVRPPLPAPSSLLPKTVSISNLHPPRMRRRVNRLLISGTNLGTVRIPFTLNNLEG